METKILPSVEHLDNVMTYLQSLQLEIDEAENEKEAMLNLYNPKYMKSDVKHHYLDIKENIVDSRNKLAEILRKYGK